MKLLIGNPFDKWRLTKGKVIEYYGTVGDAQNGFFAIPDRHGHIAVIASVGDGWDHVSVSRGHRCPTWEEMVRVKRAFFKDDEWCVEYHPPPSGNISHHPYTLHLWRPHDQVMPIPPEYMV